MPNTLINDAKSKPMTPDQKLQSLSPVRLIIGYDKEGNFSSVICETKEDMIVAIKKYEEFKVFKLIESETGEWYRNKMGVFEKRTG